MTSMFTVVGVAADALGFCTNRTYGVDERGAAWRHDEHWQTPSTSYRCDRDRVGIDWRHGDKIIGFCHYLERQHGNLWAIGEVDLDRLDGITELAAGPTFWSPETWDTRSRHGVDAELLGIALTPTPGSNALPPVKVLAGDLDYAARRAPRPVAARLERAAEARRRRRHGQHIHIHDLDTPTAPPPTVHDQRAAAGMAPRSNSGRFTDIPGVGRREIFHSAPAGRVLSVR